MEESEVKNAAAIADERYLKLVEMLEQVKENKGLVSAYAVAVMGIDGEINFAYETVSGVKLLGLVEYLRLAIGVWASESMEGDEDEG